jgi:aldehyde:ferredoxin oxidoreductase
VLDSLIVCKFLRKCFADFYAEAAELLGKVTGWGCSSAELKRIGERIHNLKTVQPARGWRSEDDWLPDRLLSETLPTGVAQGTGLTPTSLEKCSRVTTRQEDGTKADTFREKVERTRNSL